MKCIIAISRREIEDAPDAFWCTWDGYELTPGDYVIVYIISKGIKQVFMLTYVDDTSQEIKCIIRNMSTIRLQHLITAENPLTAKEMKAIKKLKDLNFVRRNFQGTTFNISPESGKDILDELAIKNPKQIEGIENIKGGLL